MLTKNFYKFMRVCMQQVAAKFKLPDGSEAKYNTEQIVYYNGMAPFEAMAAFTASGVGSGVAFGTGTTAPTPDDYCLEKPITSGLTVTTPSAVTHNQTAEYEEYTSTFGVTATDTVTITEIGLCAAVYAGGSPHVCAFMERTVLEEPIEIPAGESRQITYTIRFNYATA